MGKTLILLYSTKLFLGNVVISFNRVMTGDNLIDSEAAEEEERFWKSMYYRLVHKFNELKLNKKKRVMSLQSVGCWGESLSEGNEKPGGEDDGEIS